MLWNLISTSRAKEAHTSNTICSEWTAGEISTMSSAYLATRNGKFVVELWVRPLVQCPVIGGVVQHVRSRCPSMGLIRHTAVFACLLAHVRRERTVVSDGRWRRRWLRSPNSDAQILPQMWQRGPYVVMLVTVCRRARRASTSWSYGSWCQRPPSPPQRFSVGRQSL